MDNTISINGLTTEILAACLSKEAAAADAREELRAFLKAADCDQIRLQLIGVAAYVQTGRVFDSPGELESFLRDTELDLDRAVDALLACTKFFMMGWHARGAIEDTEKLKQLLRIP